MFYRLILISTVIIFFYQCIIQSQTNIHYRQNIGLSESNQKALSLRTPTIHSEQQSLNSLNLTDENEGNSVFRLSDGTVWRNSSEINSLRMLAVAGTVASLEVIGIVRLKDTWYTNETTKFHTMNFKEDMRRNLWMDKYGHFLHAYFATGLLSRSFRWAGMSGSESILYGTLAGWLWILQIEIADGFFKDWGFSWGDLIANTAGVGFSALQQTYPEQLGGIQPKISYHMSEAYINKRYRNDAKWIIDDYEGMTFWLGVNVYHYMPEGIKSDYPAWLKPFGIAIGTSAKGIAEDIGEAHREFFIGLDFDLRKIKTGEQNGLLKFLLNEFNIIRLPLPAIRISPSGVWYGLYF